MFPNPMDVSVIIVSWNTRDILRDCLSSVFSQTKGIKFEVIVVDNASTDGSVAIVRSEFPQVKLIQNDVNKGFAAANNQGIAIAEGRYVLLLNSDTEVLDNAIGKTVSFADAHIEAGAVSCRVLNPDRTLQMTCFMFPSVLNMLLSATYLYKLFARSIFFGREQMSWWNRDDEREVDVVTGCFMLVRREAIEKAGLMDERFFMYCEETDWCYRFKKAGWKILFTPIAEIIHFGGQSSKQAAPAMTLQLRGSVLQFMRKHYCRLEYNIACILVWLFFAVRVPGWFVKYIFTRTQKDYCRTRLLTYLVGMKRLIRGGAEGLCVNS
jgi:GT2 family glycosyltransferase